MSISSSIKSIYINLAQDKKYPISFGKTPFQSLTRNDIGDATKILVITNQTVLNVCKNYLKDVSESLPCDVFFHVMVDGENFKTLDSFSSIIDDCVNYRLGRKDLIIAFGGGVVGDIAGFAAAAYLRGIRFIQYPTSLLAQVDAAIGGKTGVNHSRGKNLIGAFHQPIKTLVDPSLLSTLPPKEMKEGLAEIIKYGIIQDKPLFWYLEQHADALVSFDYDDCPDIWNHVIQKSIENKAQVVSQDEKESELREILNFGHTIAHAIELTHGYGCVSHGNAVAIGMIIESLMAKKLDMLSVPVYQRMIELIQSFKFPLTVNSMDRDNFFNALKLDKKVRKNQLRFVLPVDIGQTKTISNIDEDVIIDSMNEWFGGNVL